MSSRYVSRDPCRIEKNMDVDPGREVLLCDALDIVVSDIRNKSPARLGGSRIQAVFSEKHWMAIRARAVL